MPLLEALSKASTEFILGNAKAEALPERFRQWLEMITAVTANAFRHAQTLARSQNLMAAIQEGKIDANFERLIADSVGLDAGAIERRMNGVDNARLDPETSHDSNAIETGSSSFSVSSSIRSTFASPPSSLTFEPSDESRPRILEIARENGLSLVVPTDGPGQVPGYPGAGARGLQERFGVETFFYRGGDRKNLGFSPRGNPELIFINADPKRSGVPAAWVFAHELLHVAQKDSKADAAGLARRITELLTLEELAEAQAQISSYGYGDTDFATELPAFLAGDAISGHFVFALGDLTRAEEIRAEIENYFDGLGKLSPSSLAEASDNDLASGPPETIGERLSKLRKRPAANGDDLEKAIAEKILKRVDRQAAKPQLHEKGRWKKLGAPRGSDLFAEDLTLTPEEKEILQSPYEILLIHTADGRLLKVRLGTKEDSNLPGDLPPGAIITHNHPGGRGPSDGDLKAVLMNPGATFRIITRNKSGKIEIFSLRATSSLSNNQINAIAGAYYKNCQAGGDTAAARHKALVLLSKQTDGLLVINQRTLP